MCGIAGLMTGDGSAPSIAVLDRLADALAHRGPDGRGRTVADDCGLVQTRLAIIDLTTGDQPLFGPDGTALVANGEVYNHIELRGEMPEVGFRTGSDCEPPLALYRRMGTGYPSRLRGMFAIALHDRGGGRLVLTRDPFGIKPLYYAESAAGLAFASEPQALVAAGLVTPKVRPGMRDQLLALQFTTGPDCIFDGITRLGPGETIVVERGRVVERRRLDALPAGGPLAADGEMMVQALDGVLAESVDLHQRSDVPYGLFLSGGIDSAAILAMMARLNQNPVLAFTAAFPGTGAADERARAGACARAVGARQVEVEVTAADFWRTLPAIAAALDDPVADYAIVPTWALAAEARKQVKVILSGEGGDELFAGYGRYRGAMRPWPFSKRMRGRGTFDGLGVLRAPGRDWRTGLAAAERAEAKPGRSRLQWAQAVDCAEWLPNDLLTKLDRCLMAHGIEGRVPFLDPVVAAFAFRLPDSLKLHRGMGKWVLRRWLATGLPAAEPYARKQGFTVPVAEWIAGRPEVGRLVARQPGVAEVAEPGAVERLFAHPGKRTGFAAWTLLFYALWHRRHIEGLRREGDVFDVLG